MDLALIRNQIYRGLGEPSFWNPASDISDGGLPALTWVANEGQRRVAMWKDTRGRHVRHRSLINDMYFNATNFTDTIATVNNSTFPYYITVDGDNVGAGDDRYNGWVFKLTSGDANGQQRLIVDYDSSTGRLYYSEVLTSDPAADDTIKMYKNFDMLLPSTHAWVDEHISLPSTSDNSRATGNLIEVLSLIDVLQSYLLSKAYIAEHFEDNYYSTGDPTKWLRVGNRIYYDVAVDIDKTFKLTYYRTPTDMVAAEDESELEEQYHYGIVLWGLIWGYLQLGESSRKYSVEQDFDRFMKTTKSQWDVESEKANPKGIIKLRRGGN